MFPDGSSFVGSFDLQIARVGRFSPSPSTSSLGQLTRGSITMRKNWTDKRYSRVLCASSPAAWVARWIELHLSRAVTTLSQADRLESRGLLLTCRSVAIAAANANGVAEQIWAGLSINPTRPPKSPKALLVAQKHPLSVASPSPSLIKRGAAPGEDEDCEGGVCAISSLTITSPQSSDTKQEMQPYAIDSVACVDGSTSWRLELAQFFVASGTIAGDEVLQPTAADSVCWLISLGRLADCIVIVGSLIICIGSLLLGWYSARPRKSKRALRHARLLAEIVCAAPSHARMHSAAA